MNKTVFPFTTLLLTASALTGVSQAQANESISFSGDYYVYGLSSSEVMTTRDSNAAAGIARATFNWQAYTDETDQDSGQLQIRVDQKHAYTDDSPSGFVMGNLGGFGLIQPAFSDIGLRLTNLYWKQEFNAQDTELMVGFLDSTDYIDTYALGNPYSGFSNLHFSTGAGAIAIPDESTLGVSLRHMMSDNYYAYFSFSDAKADSTEPFDGLDNFVSDNQYFKSLEIGWVSSKNAFYVQNSHLIVWHSDGSGIASSENYGANWSTIYMIDNWMPFFRAGVAEGSASLYQATVAAGTGYSGLGPGTLGIALGWAKPVVDQFDDTFNSEIYYSMKFGPVSVTPNIQYISSLPSNSQDDSAFVFGIRGHVGFTF
ncbi:carbohydrate porin [Vibrio ostreicida]|uniref:Carbohydrate porin n=1 Tax=Vibrio ostreicida TaxID=526588 RepID=A0ABT8C2E6_9VIBR|nr:carbohydrate porin [Vibrio ostreicida]MDN3612517.1 carbohydrate porin [Vibrio ostreicida]NPD09142.1 porin [Vibrio ostreicida]